MNGYIGDAAGELLFKLFGENALAADFGNRGIEIFVTLGFHAADFRMYSSLQQSRGNGFGLPHGQFTFSCSYSYCRHTIEPI
jgi:hypothetical protein